MGRAARIEVVAFDCDSTLSTLEGIDELARRAGVADRIAALTAAAMEGQLPVEEVYARRLDLVRPGARDLAWLGDRYCETLVPGARELVAALAAEGRDVHIVSGGVRQAVLPLAAALGLAPERVHAVAVHLDGAGRFAGWDTTAPTARSGGKADVVRTIARGRPVVLVGDGVTDLEAQAAGARVIGFGGVAARERVRVGADAYVTDASLLPVLAIIHAWEAAAAP